MAAEFQTQLPASLPLAQKTILIVEDEPLIALDLESTVRDAGGRVAGPVSSIADGLELAKSTPLDGAILDHQVSEGATTELIAWLSSHRIPVVVYSGHADADSYNGSAAIAVVRKPLAPEYVVKALSQLLK